MRFHFETCYGISTRFEQELQLEGTVPTSCTWIGLFQENIVLVPLQFVTKKC